ncbi:UNKNOWN [Stylonychia lemnae]|uniref:Uncharacterized protein n=1 Tax=Stylonychia lemnae TaxID=5949 RepID=A0A078AGY2_STYLE|nr:UNKNOWN [Stylonychia lemnae]|eukprot:CDW80118.1 UNKNOWN [Stylonychia lemnae]
MERPKDQIKLNTDLTSRIQVSQRILEKLQRMKLDDINIRGSLPSQRNPDKQLKLSQEFNLKLESQSSIAKSNYYTHTEKNRPYTKTMNPNDSYNDSMMSSNDRRRVLTTMLNENRIGGDYSGTDTLNSFLYDNQENNHLHPAHHNLNNNQNNVHKSNNYKNGMGVVNSVNNMNSNSIRYYKNQDNRQGNQPKRGEGSGEEYQRTERPKYNNQLGQSNILSHSPTINQDRFQSHSSFTSRYNTEREHQNKQQNEICMQLQRRNVKVLTNKMLKELQDQVINQKEQIKRKQLEQRLILERQKKEQLSQQLQQKQDLEKSFSQMYLSHSQAKFETQERLKLEREQRIMFESIKKAQQMKLQRTQLKSKSKGRNQLTKTASRMRKEGSKQKSRNGGGIPLSTIFLVASNTALATYILINKIKN